MRALSLVRRVLADDGHVLYECRRCGTSVEHETSTCPYCESARIARYELS